MVDVEPPDATCPVGNRGTSRDVMPNASVWATDRDAEVANPTVETMATHLEDEPSASGDEFIDETIVANPMGLRMPGSIAPWKQSKTSGL